MGREKDKKSRMEYHARRKATLPIVDRLKNELENNVGQLKSKELEVLLQWKGVPVLTMGNIANRQILYQQFSEGGVEEASIPALWTEINKAELIALRDASIAMWDTAYTGDLRSRRRGMRNKRTRRCPPRRRSCSNKRWWRSMMQTPTIGNPRHLPLPLFS